MGLSWRSIKMDVLPAYQFILMSAVFALVVSIPIIVYGIRAKRRR